MGFVKLGLWITSPPWGGLSEHRTSPAMRRLVTPGFLL